MKKILGATLLLGSLSGLVAEAAPFYRIWRGYKKTELKKEDFQSAIGKIFVEATVEYGAGQSLTGYVPAIPNPVADTIVPDEIALVIYESKEKYEALRATPIGIGYGDLHWEYFERAPVNPVDPAPTHFSKSTVAEGLPESLEVLTSATAYDVLKNDANWQKGLVKIRFLKRDTDTAEKLKAELDAVKQITSEYAAKALGYIFLVDDKYLMTYELWKDAAALKESGYEDFLKTKFSVLGDNEITAQNTGLDLTGMQDLEVKDGVALNAQFDANEKVEYIDDTKVDEFVTKSVSAAYPTLKGTADLFQNDDAPGLIDRLYEVTYKDEQGVPVDHTETLHFKLEKTPLTPAGKLLVIRNGEVQH